MKNILLFLLFVPQVSLAQTAESIRSGRPGQAIDPYVAGMGIFQIQSGIDRLTSKNQGQDLETLNSNMVWRFGISEQLEINGLWVFQKDQVNNSGLENSIQGVSQFHLGFRFNILSESDGLIPSLGLQARFKLPFVGSDYTQKNIGNHFTLVFQHDLGAGFGWTHNFGIDSSGDDLVSTYFWVSNLSYGLNEKWSVFIELYGFERAGRDTQYIDAGLAYLWNNNLQLDLFAGAGENFGVRENLVSFGFSWRLELLNKI